MISQPTRTMSCCARRGVVVFGFAMLVSFGGAFSPQSCVPFSSTTLHRAHHRRSLQNCPYEQSSCRIVNARSTTSTATTLSFGSTSDDNSASSDSNRSPIWLPQLRRIMASIASIGMIETGYLTYQKSLDSPLQRPASTFLAGLCNVDGTCNSVLNGPYSTVPFTSIPLAAVGFVAYSGVLLLALAPLVLGSTNQDDDTDNRVLLTVLTTAMGTFSIFLMTLLFGVLKTTCVLCILSACLSITLAMMTWVGRCLPNEEIKKDGMSTNQQLSIPGMQSVTGGGIAATTLLSLALFFGTAHGSGATTSGESALSSGWNANSNNSGSSSLLASSTTTRTTEKQQEQQTFSPPEIESDSSDRAMALAKQLEKLNAKMYGAYWCSHCYDQKETLGKQAFAKVQYIECSKDGTNSQTKLCKANNVPGYPTWEIAGELYPGQQEIDELEDLVKLTLLTR